MSADERARLDVLPADRLDHALFAARSIDTGDTGLTVLTGLRTAFALFRGQGTSSLADQQRADLALKLLGLAFVLTRLFPGDGATVVDRARQLPAGRRILRWTAVAEVALPFQGEVLAGGGRFVTDQLAAVGATAAGRLLAVAGKAGLADAEAALPLVAAAVDVEAMAQAPNVERMSGTLAGVLPSVAAPAAGIVASAADALPCWRVLVARLAAEAVVSAAVAAAVPAQAAAPAVDPTPAPVPSQPAAAPVVTPTTPAPSAKAGRMGGVWLDAENNRLDFDEDGTFRHTRYPDRRGVYRRAGDALELDWPDVRTTRHALRRTATRLFLDDAVYRRADWDLTGRCLQGVWVADDGRTLRFGVDHRWDGSEGGGTYRLGPARLHRTRADGRESVERLWSDGLPHARTPDLLFVDDQRWTRTQSPPGETP